MENACRDENFAWKSTKYCRPSVVIDSAGAFSLLPCLKVETEHSHKQHIDDIVIAYN